MWDFVTQLFGASASGERNKVEAQLRSMQGELERRVAERTAELAQANAALQVQIDERQRMEGDLRRQHGWQRVLLASIGDAVIATDDRGTVTLLNPRAEQWTGWSAEQAVGQPVENVLRFVNEESREPIASPFERAIRDNPLSGFADHTVLIRKDGSERPIEESAAPIRADSGMVIGAVIVLHDITERRRWEREIQQADRRKDEFLAMLSHELRNPLAPLRNAIFLLKRDKTDPATLDWALDMMERQVENMVRLVDDLLDVSRITRGKIDLQRSPVELTTVVERAVETARPLIDSRRHQLVVELPKQLIWLDADTLRLTQAFANLLNNAAKYTEPGGEIRLTAEQETGGVAVRVKDNGIGIEPDLLPQVFNLFTQADRALGRSQGGLGIGLTLVRSLIEMHGGTVSAASRGPGQGSEFTIHLPARAEQASTEEQAAATAPVVPRRMLVVEDNVGAALVLSKLLSTVWGHEVQVAHDGRAALEMARACRPEVVLLDLGLPDLSGLEVARELRASDGGAAMLIVALTGYDEKDDRRRTAEADFDEHFVKPPGVDMLQRLFSHPKLKKQD